MAEQLALIVEDYDDAIVQTIKAIGGFKCVGAELRPDIDAITAGRWLADACNPRERETLKPSQLAWIRASARAKGVHALAAYEMCEAGYAPPLPVEPEDERAALQRQFVEQSKAMQQLFARMERSGIKAVS